MSEPIVIAVITQAAAVVIVLLQQNKKLNRIGSDAREAREQTANDHANADYPNLRDELTATRGLIHGLVRQFGGLEQWVRDLASGADRIDDTINRKALIAARELADFKEEREERLARMLRQEIPEIVRREIAQHVADCPLRNQGGTS